MRQLLGEEVLVDRADSQIQEPSAVERFAESDRWKEVLGEPPHKAIKRFVSDGMLVSADLSGLLSYKFKLIDLKPLLKERGLPVSGRKDNLIARLVEADPKGMKKAVAGLVAFECSDRGREIANQYLITEKEKRETVERKVFEQLQKGKFKEASTLVASYEAEQVFPRVMGIDWKHYDPQADVDLLKTIFTAKPKILAPLDKHHLAALRPVSGMQLLWGSPTAQKWIPPGLDTGLAMDNDTAARMLWFYAVHRRDLEQWRQGGLGIKTAIIRTAGDYSTCEPCQKLAGKRYKLSEVPELPYEKCTSERGCRCMLIPDRA